MNGSFLDKNIITTKSNIKLFLKTNPFCLKFSQSYLTGIAWLKFHLKTYLKCTENQIRLKKVFQLKKIKNRMKKPLLKITNQYLYKI